MLTAIKGSLKQPVGSAPLIVVRVTFGLLMALAFLRTWLNGWIDTQYILPPFHFKYLGFEWVQLPPDWAVYVLFAALIVLALCIAVGFAYRLTMPLFFVLFTYHELLDQATYLNHYYFVSLFSLLLCFLPLNQRWSLDVYLGWALPGRSVPQWMVWTVRLQLALVYFWAGVAKLNADWLLHAMPLTIWLRTAHDVPIIGPWLTSREAAYAFSWAGAAFDLSIPLWLMWRRTHRFAYVVVLIFHVLTGVLFPVIGLFPFLMIVCTLAFFDEPTPDSLSEVGIPSAIERGRAFFLLGFLGFQLVMPLRHWLYPGEVLWTEEGFRFSWRVMLVEKTGDVVFKIHDPIGGRTWDVYPSDELTPLQDRQMSYQPDMILQYAHHLAARVREEEGLNDVEVYAEAWVSFNGRRSCLLIDPTIDLIRTAPSLWHKPWILQPPMSDLTSSLTTGC